MAPLIQLGTSLVTIAVALIGFAYTDRQINHLQNDMHKRFRELNQCFEEFNRRF